VRAFFGDGWTAFLVRHALVQNLPHETTEPMRDRADGLRMAQPHDRTAIHELKDTAFGLDGGIGGLIEQASHLAVAVPAIRQDMASPGGSGERAHVVLFRSQAIAALTEHTNDAHLFAQARTLRIIQFSGFTCSTGSTDLAARASAILPNPRGFSCRFAS